MAAALARNGHRQHHARKKLECSVTPTNKSSREAVLPFVFAACVGLFCALSCREAKADDASTANPADQQWAVHGQFTNITQQHSVFAAPYSGPNSLSPNGDAEETTDLTLFAGRRLWQGSELWLNSEIDQGFGFNDTLGIAGFPNGGAYKIGANTPYLRFPRLFVRQVIALGGAEENVAAAANELGGDLSANNLTLTIGKFSVVDIFDTNSYAHDPRADFLNWTIIDAGAFDYAADSWGYTYGAAVEWNQDWWTLRGGVFQLSAVPNGKVTRVDFSENSIDVEAEARYAWQGHPGKIKLLAFINHGNMASYQAAVLLGQETGTVPAVAPVRQIGSRPGVVLNLEQELSSSVGAFARLSQNRGDKETYEFSDINKSASAGLSLKGALWGRDDDTVGVAGVINALSGDAQEYFAAGGLGLLVGDGRLNYAPEKIMETYYSLHLNSYTSLAFDYQQVAHPAYSLDRGPVSIYGVRLHASF
jgi:high affinity Mn2+ porin